VVAAATINWRQVSFGRAILSLFIFLPPEKDVDKKRENSAF
jgi:hypothetical protein